MNGLDIVAGIVVIGTIIAGVTLAIYAASDLPRIWREWRAKHGKN